MSAETKQEKSRRLIAEGKVAHQLDLPNGASVWRVAGDSGRSRQVTLDLDGTTTCTCPHLHADCAHALAVLTAAGLNPGDPMPSAPTDTDVLDPAQPDTAASAPAPPEPATDPIPSDEPAAGLTHTGEPGLVAIAEAPITWRTLEALSHTEFVPAGLRGRPAAVLGAVRLGREYGLGPLEALRLIDVIDGSPSPNAELMGRLYRRAGHQLAVTRADNQAVEITGTRGDTGETLTTSYTIEDALAAGLVDSISEDGTPRARSRNGHPMPWETYTADLLWARALTRLVRRLAPDALDHPDL